MQDLYNQVIEKKVPDSKFTTSIFLSCASTEALQLFSHDSTEDSFLYALSSGEKDKEIEKVINNNELFVNSNETIHKHSLRMPIIGCLLQESISFDSKINLDTKNFG